MKTLKNISVILILFIFFWLLVFIVYILPINLTCGVRSHMDTTFLKMNQLSQRLDMFKLDNGQYPETNEGFEALIQNPDIAKYPNYRPKLYLKAIPRDSWKTPYIYKKIGEEFDIISYASDGKEGGIGASRDLSFVYTELNIEMKRKILHLISLFTVCVGGTITYPTLINIYLIPNFNTSYEQEYALPYVTFYPTFSIHP